MSGPATKTVKTAKTAKVAKSVARDVIDFEKRQGPESSVVTMTSKSVLFWRPPSLGNWTIVPFEMDGVQFNCSEQAFMYQKAMLFNDHDTAHNILMTKDPSRHKRLGRQVKNFDEQVWQLQAYTIMTAVLYAKFSGDKEWGDYLVSTGERTLIEASPVDTQYGVGMTAEQVLECDEDPAKFKGKNWLGKALEQARSMIVAARNGVGEQ